MNNVPGQFLLVIVTVALLAACSNQAIYESVQHANMQECQENPPSARERCMEQVSEPYEDYARSRKEVLEDKP